MTFAQPATSYDRFMGRFSMQLAPRFADFAGIAAEGGTAGAGGAGGTAGAGANPCEPGGAAGWRVLDVGCGPGALAGELARRLGAPRVAAIDPAPQFAAACAERLPGAEVRNGPAEALPWQDSTFHAALAQLVVIFMQDAPAGVREMARVTATGGTVALAMWGRGEDLGVAQTFWQAAEAIDPGASAAHEQTRYRSEDELAALLDAAGAHAVATGRLRVSAGYTGFDDWWDSVRTGTGPVGAYVSALDDGRLARIREAALDVLGNPSGPFELHATAAVARGSVG